MSMMNIVQKNPIGVSIEGYFYPISQFIVSALTVDGGKE